MTAVQAIQQSEPLPAPVSGGDAVLQMIERAVRDPSVDVHKMRELFALRKEMMAIEAERNFDAAMADAQAEMRPVAVDASNPQTKSRYASYHALDLAIRPIYSARGFSIRFGTADGAPEGYIRITSTTALGGHRQHDHIDMPTDGKGAKGNDVMTKTHATGAAITYGRRYLLGMIFNIAVGSDDDGNGATIQRGAPKTIDAAQFRYLKELMETADADEAKMLAYLNAEAVEELDQVQFKRAEALLRKKIKDREAAQ